MTADNDGADSSERNPYYKAVYDAVQASIRVGGPAKGALFWEWVVRPSVLGGARGPAGKLNMVTPKFWSSSCMAELLAHVPSKTLNTLGEHLTSGIGIKQVRSDGEVLDVAWPDGRHPYGVSVNDATFMCALPA